MAAPEGNQFWKIRATHGRKRIIESPEALWESAQAYFKWCDENPLIQIDYRGKDPQPVEIPHPRPYQKGMLAIYCHLSEWRLINDLKGVSDDFSQVVTRIEQIIFNQKLTGASVGFYNSNIIARDLGLVDKKQNEIKGEQRLFDLGDGKK